jgi:hypothetical protein
MQLSQSEIETILRNAGFKGIDLINAVKICLCESGFDPAAHNTNNEDSRGLFQINVIAHPEYSYLDLFDPQINANVAFEIFTQSGNKFTAWKNCAASSNIIEKTMLFGIGFVLIAGIIYINNV